MRGRAAPARSDPPRASRHLAHREHRGDDVQLPTSLRTDLALDALEIPAWTRRREGRDVSGLTQHRDKGAHQHVAVPYTQRLAAAGAAASVESMGNNYDNTLAETFNSLP